MSGYWYIRHLPPRSRRACECTPTKKVFRRRPKPQRGARDVPSIAIALDRLVRMQPHTDRTIYKLIDLAGMHEKAIVRLQDHVHMLIQADEEMRTRVVCAIARLDEVSVQVGELEKEAG